MRARAQARPQALMGGERKYAPGGKWTFPGAKRGRLCHTWTAAPAWGAFKNRGADLDQVRRMSRERRPLSWPSARTTSAQELDVGSTGTG